MSQLDKPDEQAVTEEQQINEDKTTASEQSEVSQTAETAEVGQTPEAQPAKKSKLPFKHLWSKTWFRIAFIVTLLVLIGGGGTTWKVLSSRNNRPTPVTTATQEEKPKEEPDIEGEVPIDETPAPSGEDECAIKPTKIRVAKWSGQATEVSDLKIFKDYSDRISPKPTDPYNRYYKVGTATNNTDVILSVASFGSLDERSYITLKDTDGYHIIVSPGQTPTPDQAHAYGCESGIFADVTTRISEFDISNLTYKGVKLKATSNYSLSIFFSSANPKPLNKLTDTANGTLYEEIYNQKGGVKMTRFVLKLPDTELMTFRAETPLKIESSDYNQPAKAPEIIWNDNTKNTIVYGTQFTGCGSYGTIQEIESPSPADYVKVGALGGRTIYGFSSTNNSLFNTYYQEYKDNSEWVEDKNKNLSADDFQKRHAIIIDHDEFGRWLIYVDPAYFAGGGCAKPVIYLYPTQPQFVSVKLDVDVKVSIPLYQNGWKALAMPNGKLFTTSGMYDSLFWEGQGQIYPEVNAGFIVKQEELATKMRNHLAQQGLNEKESNDFMEYWLPRMPKTPYVRLTWFGNKQLELLAPLHVSPAPDTVIRTFLDFEGLEQPIDLPGQRLSAPLRSGFTVVEWGGLLKGELK